jgi:leucyl aminopeptidase
MEFSTKLAMPEKQPVACVAAGVFESRKLSGAADALDKAAHGQIRELLRSGDMDGKVGSTRLLYRVRGVAAERVLLVGRGGRKNSARSSTATAHARHLPPFRKRGHATLACISPSCKFPAAMSLGRRVSSFWPLPMSFTASIA